MSKRYGIVFLVNLKAGEDVACFGTWIAHRLGVVMITTDAGHRHFTRRRRESTGHLEPFRGAQAGEQRQKASRGEGLWLVDCARTCREGATTGARAALAEREEWRRTKPCDSLARYRMTRELEAILASE